MRERRTGLIERSVSAKLNILIVIILFIVSAMLILISNGAYRRAVFGSAEEELNDAAIPYLEEMVTIMDHFLQLFETDEFREAREKYKPGMRDEDGVHSMANWMNEHPSWRQLDLNEHVSSTLLYEWIDLEMMAEDLWEYYGLNSIHLEVQKDGATYWIYSKTSNEEIKIVDYFDYIGLIRSDFPDLSPDGFTSAMLTQVGKKTLYLRCIHDKMEGGGEYCIWISDDMTTAITEYRKFLLRSILSALGATILLIGLMVFVLQRQISRPISHLARATQAFVPEEDGTYSAERISQVRIKTRDELGELSRQICSMQEQIVENTGNLARMTAERERINTEMNLARSIQASALPAVFPAFPDRTEFGLYASMTPAREVGGDFYDFFLVDDDHLALVIADVSGKGIPAALFMMNARALIRNQLMTGRDPAEAVTNVNQQLFEGNAKKMFVTVWLAVLELSTGRGTACNAGHEHPCLRRAGGEFEMVRYAHDKFVGPMKKAQFHPRRFELGAGDCLFVYTDGIPEAMNGNGEAFGEDRLTEVLNRDPGAQPEELISRVRDAVALFAGDTLQSDDLTMLCLKYNGPRS